MHVRALTTSIYFGTLDLFNEIASPLTKTLLFGNNQKCSVHISIKFEKNGSDFLIFYGKLIAKFLCSQQTPTQLLSQVLCARPRKGILGARCVDVISF